jgi:hypothetical protein
VLAQNGEVSRLMCRMGIINKLNYGVPVTTLRQIAQQFYPNHALGLKLWQQDIREAKIMASMLTQPEQLTSEEIQYIINTIDNLEFAELFGRDIISQINQTSLLELMIAGNPWQIVAAVYASGWAIRKNMPYAIQYSEWFIKNIEKIAKIEIAELRQPILFAMQSASTVDLSTKDKICSLSKLFSLSDNQFTKRIGDDYQWLCGTIMISSGQ